jgi:hypothetical protein
VGAQGAASGAGTPGRLKGNWNARNLPLPRLRRETGIAGLFWWQSHEWQRVRVRELLRQLPPRTVADLCRWPPADVARLAERRT